MGRAFGLLFEQECEQHYRDRESPSHWLVKTSNGVGSVYGKAVYFIGTDEIVR